MEEMKENIIKVFNDSNIRMLENKNSVKLNDNIEENERKLLERDYFLERRLRYFLENLIT
jgi:hypothetical protein